jgi:ketosteroid isomerase-like protein
MELWEVIAREQIRDTLARYNAAGDRGDARTLAEQFLPDGVLAENTVGEFVGREAIEGFIGGVATSHEPASTPGARLFVHHHVSSVTITVATPTRAEAASYFAVFTHDRLDHWGRYRDVLAPHGDRWLIERRTVRVDKDIEGGIHHEFVQRSVS